MKRILPLLILASTLALLALENGCSVTPHANLGVGLDYSNGSFRLRPHASVGVYGRP